MIHDNKKAVSVILAGLGPKPEQQDEGMPEVHAIAQEILEAVEKKDVAGLADALGAFMQCAQEEDEKQDHEEMQEGEHE